MLPSAAITLSTSVGTSIPRACGRRDPCAGSKGPPGRGTCPAFPGVHHGWKEAVPTCRAGVKGAGRQLAGTLLPERPHPRSVIGAFTVWQVASWQLLPPWRHLSGGVCGRQGLGGGGGRLGGCQRKRQPPLFKCHHQWWQVEALIYKLVSSCCF